MDRNLADTRYLNSNLPLLSFNYHMQSINQSSHHSAAEHTASTRFLHRTLLLATHLISAQVMPIIVVERAVWFILASFSLIQLQYPTVITSREHSP